MVGVVERALKTPLGVFQNSCKKDQQEQQKRMLSGLLPLLLLSRLLLRLINLFISEGAGPAERPV